MSCFYIDGFAYQENELVRQHVRDGHVVTVIASTETFDKNGKLHYVEPAEYQGGEGARVLRLGYRKFLPHFLMRKARMHNGVFELLCQLRPDAILFHGLCGWELNAVARYKKKNPEVLTYVDSHEDQHNSATSFLSKYVLHRTYYARIIRRCLPFFSKVLCVSLETIDFVRRNYGVPDEALEFFPLGGHVFDDGEYFQRRAEGRRRSDVADNDTMFLQTGKMGRKKRVLESLDAFVQTPGDHLRFVLAGTLDEDIREDAEEYINGDKRITFLGWQSTRNLEELLCAADVYVQPGTQSATMQMSLCARCPVVLDSVPSHEPFVRGNGWLIKSVEELLQVFAWIRDNGVALQEMSAKSQEIAKSMLDYRVLAARVLK